MNTVPALDGQTDVVVSAQYKLEGVQDTYSANITAWCQFTLKQGSGFTPYNELTQDQVIGWAQDTIGASTVTALQRNIQEKIDAQITPPPEPSPQPLPWNNQL